MEKRANLVEPYVRYVKYVKWPFQWLARHFWWTLLGVIVLREFVPIVAGMLAIAVFVAMIIAIKRKEMKFSYSKVVKMLILLGLGGWLCVSGASKLCWEWSRGGALWHFEDFSTSEEMQTYLEEHYPAGSDSAKAAYDAESAGGRCDFYMGDWHCVYEKFSVFHILYTYEYDIRFYLNKNKNITKISSFINIAANWAI